MPKPTDLSWNAICGQIIAREIEGATTGEEVIAALGKALSRLAPSMSALIGEQGFRAVLARAVYLTSLDFRWLQLDERSDQATQVRAEPSKIAFAEAQAAGCKLLENLVVLLTRFIGKNLTSKVVRAAWPEVFAVAEGGVR